MCSHLSVKVSGARLRVGLSLVAVEFLVSGSCFRKRHSTVILKRPPPGSIGHGFSQVEGAHEGGKAVVGGHRGVHTLDQLEQGDVRP